MSGKSYLNNREYHRHNYFEAIKYLIPEYLYEDDRKNSPKEDDLADVVVNSNISLANNIASVINVSSIAGGSSEGLNTFAGIAPYFIKQNQLTDITPEEFENDILLFLFDKSFKEFQTVESFSSYVDSTIIPATELNKPSSTAVSSPAEIHEYLVTKNSWLYFLNTTGTSFDGSSLVADLIVNKLFKGKSINTSDAIQALMEYIWRNDLDFYPKEYFSAGSRFDLSGTQQLDKLKTWIDIVYSPLHSDKSDFRVRNKFENFLDSSILTTRKIEDGPFARFIRALSFLAYDIDNLSETISTIYDLEDCPDEFLPLLAKLIGWDLFGSDPARWRLQLRNATDIYKTVGTKKSIQFALNSVFPKDQFPIQTSLAELWESYVPYLIYYSLATESRFFESYDTWTPNLSQEMGVLGYTTSSMDDNISRATDRILHEIYLKFPDKFNIPNIEDGFFYRGNVNPIPPYEEFPYYVNVELNKPMIDFIADRLVCFGVRNDFAIDVSGYLTQHSLDFNDEPRDGSFLLFTSGYKDPPNLSRMIDNANSKGLKYLSLWSGKSSHFKLAINANSFDFTKKGLITADTGDAVVVASQMTKKFAPTHSIPLISLEVSGDVDNLYGNDEYFLPLVTPDCPENIVAANNNYLASGLYLASYKRGVGPVGKVLSRKDTQSAVSPRILSASSLGSLPRRSSRRRSYKNSTPKAGYFDRTGFNMPSFLDMEGHTTSGTAEGQAGAIPLGYDPSIGDFSPVSSYINLPPVYKQCEDLDSLNSYFGYAVNTTMPSRGRRLHSTNVSAFDLSSVYNDRSQLPDIYRAMYNISEREKFIRVFAESGPPVVENEIRRLRAQGTIDQFGMEALENLVDQLNLLPDSFWTNAAIRGTNLNLEGFSFPSSIDDYYNFEFGRDLYRLYRLYTTEFHQHNLSPRLLDLDGPNIFSHTYGPLLFNHDFNSLYNTGLDIVTSSIGDVHELRPNVAPFDTVSAFVARTPSKMIVGSKPELVVSSIVRGVELIHTSGPLQVEKADDSSFSVFRVSKNFIKEGDDPHMFGRTFILSRSRIPQFPRIRMDISKQTLWDEGDRPLNTNFLLPNHDFELSMDGLISDDTGRSIGGREFGVWIHTKPEGDNMWSLTPNGEWLYHSSTVTKKQLLEEYAHLFLQKQVIKPINTPEASNFKCLDIVTRSIKSPVTKLRKDDFLNVSIKFNTRNNKLIEPKDYKVNFGDVHRKDQNYVVETFLVPGDTEKFFLIDDITLKDLTMKKLSERHTFGPKSDPLQELNIPKYKGIETRTEVLKDELLAIFKYFNKLSGKGETVSLTSRDDTKSSTIMGTDGGSRGTYRYKTTWLNPKFQNATLDEIKIYEGGEILT